MRFFYVAPSAVDGARAVVEGAEAAHARHVLRLSRGSEVGLVDGCGFEYLAVIDRVLPGRLELEVREKRPAAGIPSLRLGLAQGWLKEKKMDRLVRTLSELGAARFIPLSCARAVVRPAAGRSAFRRERWRRIAVEALKQCRRGNLLEVEEETSLERLLAVETDWEVRVLFWEEAATPLSAADLRGGEASSVLAVLGPEGGFSREEADAAAAAGFLVRRLGPRVLRADTAAAAAAAILQFLAGDLGAAPKRS
ncbi:MAG: RsmE family RNA methyltransferase [Desulfobacterales bacterium]